MLAQEAKQVSLLASAAELGAPDTEWTTWRLDSIKGRLLHYSVAIWHLRIRVAELARLIGPVVEADYDLPRPAPEGHYELTEECAAGIRRFAPLGTPLWPPVPSSAYAALLAGELETPFCVLTWDALPSGWATLLPWRVSFGPLLERLCIDTCPAGWDVSQQS